MTNKYESMTTEQLIAELKRLKDNLCDIEDMHNFTFGKTTVHIGAEQAQNMALEYEQECKAYSDEIAKVEKALKAKGGL
jgi:hypothetical protein